MGFRVAWSPHFAERFQGQPLKRVALSFGGETRRGEAMITQDGIEGGLVYAFSAVLRDALARDGFVDVTLDLRPDLERVVLSGGSQSLSNQLRKQAGLSPVAMGLVQEALRAGAGAPAALVKALPLRLAGTQGLERAISSAGGLAFSPGLAVPGHERVFACGEMLDWEAPTGGYLLQACFSTAVAAARAALGVTPARSG
jgi:predicted flavoprotein YhiN